MTSMIAAPAALQTRRNFLRGVGAAGAFGAMPWLAGCGGGGGDSETAPTRTKRTLYFDLSAGMPGASYEVMVFNRMHPVLPAQAHHLAAAAQDTNVVKRLGAGGTVTHVAEAIELSAQSLQLCILRGMHPSRPGTWHVEGIFHHIPKPAAAASPLSATCAPCAKAPMAAALGEQENYCTDPAYTDLIDDLSTATSLVASHPEIACFDPATASYIVQTYMCTDINVTMLAGVIAEQGPATADGGWATLIPLLDPGTNQPMLEKDGTPAYQMQYSDETTQALNAAMHSVLANLKNDPQLGGNVTGADPTSANSAFTGKLWQVHDGSPTAGAGAMAPASAPASAAAARPTLLAGVPMSAVALAAQQASFGMDDVSSDKGFRIDQPVLAGSDGRTMQFTVHNWFVRYLGMYVRFYDVNGNVIPLSNLSATELSQFPYARQNGTYDAFLGIVNQELIIFGIPIKSNTQSFTVQLPAAAVSCKLLAGGMGSGNEYPDTVLPGKVMTAVLDLAVPGLFLAMASTMALGSLMTTLAASTELIVASVQFIIQAITDVGLVGSFGDPSTLTNLVVPLLSALKGPAVSLYRIIVAAIVEGEVEEASVSILTLGFGTFMVGLSIAGTISQIVQTSVEVASSPATYARTVNFTHDVAVTVTNDPADPLGLPATATQYRVYATCENTSPYDSGLRNMPSTTTSSVTFSFALPFGGNAVFEAYFYTADNTQVGYGTSGSVPNLSSSVTFPITEVLIPLTASTRYAHKQKTVVSNGAHAWSSQAAPPVTAPNCNNAVGNVCQLVGITMSEPFAAVGYAWQSNSSSVRDYDNGASGQLYQFASLSLTSNPQSGWMGPGGGFAAPARIAYDRTSPTSRSYYLDTSGGGSPILRRIVMTGVGSPPSADSPTSGLAVGRLNFPSDAMLIHPTGKVFSLNSSLSKIEVLTPLATPVADAQAPLAATYAGPGQRQGLLSGPVCAAIAKDGTLYVLEQTNNRIQAFDCGMNPVPTFDTNYFMPLKARDCTYLDLAVEAKGYIYVLVYDNTLRDYIVDIYTPSGVWLTSSGGLNAGKITVDPFRNVYALNFDYLNYVSSSPFQNIAEPSVSQWIPST